MEPGLAAAAYTAETAIEGVETVPLQARFYRVPSPSPSLKRSSHTLNVINGKAYILGGDGDTVGGDGDAAMHVITLPTDLVLMDTDYQKIPAVGQPVKPPFDEEGNVEKRSPSNAQSGAKDENVPAARAGHSACTIGGRICVFGGSRATGSSDPTVPPNPPFEENGKVYVFDTIDKTWEVLIPGEEGCKDGVPQPRNYASSSSTTHPVPVRSEKSGGKGEGGLMTEEAKLRLVSKRQGEDFTTTDDQQAEGYGTLFIHGGYDFEENLLRDLWAFDVASRIWSRWQDLPQSDADDGEGNICCIESRIWRTGDGFGKAAHFDVVRNHFNDMGGKGELGVSPKTGEWEIHTFGVKPGQGGLEEKVEKKMGGKPTNTESLFPARRNRSGFLPVTTGQGRDYLLLFMGEKGPQEFIDDVRSFQIASEKKSAAALKDMVRAMIGKGTGVEQWAKANMVESNKADGALDFPKGLSKFGSSLMGDSIGDFLIWGGIGPNGMSGDGWMMTLE